jgi:bifunctional enzyme CysN/CysC
MPDQHFIPISALNGDNLLQHSENTPWYEGSTLMHHLENVHIASDRNFIDFRLPVQYVNRPNLDFRGFCGTVSSGRVSKGDEIMVLPSRKRSRVKSIVTFDGQLDEAFAPLAVTVTFEDEIDCSRGDTIVRPDNLPTVADRFDATVVWMAEQDLVPGKEYYIKHATRSVSGRVNTLRYKIDVNTLHRSPSATLGLNEIGRCQVQLNQPIAFDGYRRNRAGGAFIIIDRLSNVTVGAGMILDRKAADDVDYWEQEASESLEERTSPVTADERAARFGQQPVTVLLTGLPAAGKTPIAGAVERKLFDRGRAVAVIDGQSMRRGLSRDLGFSAEDRSENLRRAAEVAKLLNASGLITIAAFVAPHDEVRRKAAEVVGTERFLVAHCSAPVEWCRQHDQQGVYAKADSGEIANFPGVSAEYETPTSPDVVLPVHQISIDECANRVIEVLEARGVL